MQRRKKNSVSTTQARKVVLAARPLEKARPVDFRVEKTASPAPGPGQILLRVHLKVGPETSPTRVPAAGRWDPER